MAIHAGAADEERDLDYFGRPVNRAARLLSLAYGGQVLLSVAARGLLRNDTMPTGVSARDRGGHRLKDLDQSEHVYQLLAEGLPDDRRPLRSDDHQPGDVPVWNVPQERNVRFVGRETELTKLGQALASNQPAALVQAIHGLGGVGKTQLAVEYAHRHAADYVVVWWIHAESVSTLLGDYAALGAALNLPEAVLTDQTEGVAALRRRLAKPEGLRWLLVFDNAADVDAVGDYLPGGGGHVLITSRNPIWRRVAETLPVDVFQRHDSIQFLLARTGRNDEADAAGNLAEELGDLPLALEQAGAYIEVKDISLAGYLARSRDRRYQLRLMEEGAPPLDQYPASVATTYDLAFEQVATQSPAGAALLDLCAFLAPDAIPLDALMAYAALLPDPLTTALANPVEADDVVAALRRYSLLERTDDLTLALHPLVQALTRFRLPDEERQEWAAAAVTVLDAAFPAQSDDVRTWPTCLRLLSHGLTAVQHAVEQHVAAERTVELLNKIGGGYLRMSAQLVKSQQVMELAVAVAEATYGADHPEVGNSLNGLASVLRAQGDLAGARERFERALAISEAALGPDHPTVATALSNLVRVLHAQGDLASAKPLFERALAVRETRLGSDHPDVATSLNNLAIVLQAIAEELRAKGEFSEARRSLQQSLRYYRRAGNDRHSQEVLRLLRIIHDEERAHRRR